MLSQQVTTRSFQKKDGFLTISHRLYSILLLAVFLHSKSGKPNIITSLSTCHLQKYQSSLLGSFINIAHHSAMLFSLPHLQAFAWWKQCLHPLTLAHLSCSTSNVPK
jgi:hypothetical protein